MLGTHQIGTARRSVSCIFGVEVLHSSSCIALHVSQAAGDLLHVRAGDTELKVDQQCLEHAEEGG